MKSVNEKFRQQDIPPKIRPILALREFSKEFNCSFIITPEISNKVSSWFEKNTKPGSLSIGLLYQGAYYFDSCFWSVEVPLIFGMEVRVKPFNSLPSMPNEFKDQINSNPEDFLNFISLWADCFDYAYGYDDILKLNQFHQLATNFIKSANKELEATVSLLLRDRPEPKAIETARMATEMFLKSILIIKNSWTDEKPLKKISHNLDEAIDQCIAITNSDELKLLKQQLSFFPDVNTRYGAQEWKQSELWFGYAIAQSIGATFTRMFSSRKIIDQVISSYRVE